MKTKINKLIACSVVASTLLVASSFADEIVETVTVTPMEGVVIVTPMETAKKSLYQAMVDYTHGEYAKAKEDLNKSEKWLDKAMHSSDATVKSEAKKLKDKATELKGNLSKDTVDAKGKLEALLADSKALSAKSLNTLLSKYDQSKKTVALKADLLDAKLHLEYAKTKQFIYGTKADVKDELNKAKTSLQKASKEADAKTAQSIKAIESSINSLEKDADQTGANIKAKYESTKTEIDTAIHKL